MATNAAAAVPRLFRVIIPVSDIEQAATFYGLVLGMPGERVAPNRHYFNCGGTILTCLDPQPAGRAVKPNAEPIFFAVADLEAVYERAQQAGCRWLEESIQVQHWGERAFFAADPFGNRLGFVDVGTLFTGGTTT